MLTIVIHTNLMVREVLFIMHSEARVGGRVRYLYWNGDPECGNVGSGALAVWEFVLKFHVTN